ncbi:hypothetical protein Tco_1231345 [Tanacetum coccineum]
MMTDKYCPRGEIKKLEIELWNLKVKGTDVMSYTLRFQELALMCGRMFHKESEEVEKYVCSFMLWMFHKESEAVEKYVGGLEIVCSFMLCDLDFEPLSLSLSFMLSCDLMSLTNILILCLILKASNQS